MTPVVIDTGVMVSGIFWRGDRDATAIPGPVAAPHSTAVLTRINVQRSKLSVGRSTFFRVRPDFVFPRLKLAVFVDGCFWHGCPRHATWPAHRAAWWRRKLEGNRARDRRVNRALRAAGWRVVRIWEHQLSERGTGNAERETVRLVTEVRRLIR